MSRKLFHFHAIYIKEKALTEAKATRTPTKCTHKHMVTYTQSIVIGRLHCGIDAVGKACPYKAITTERDLISVLPIYRAPSPDRSPKTTLSPFPLHTLHLHTHYCIEVPIILQ